MFDEKIEKVIVSVIEDAKKLKKDKKYVASMTDHTDKQLYYVLTEEQFDLMFKQIKVVKEQENDK